MTGNEIRKSFIDFFKSKQHKHFDSASLVPDDKTLLLTVAGMVPFKPFFLGEKKAPYNRVTTYQKCIRTNDLENVGRTPRHQTFFEMLGNFSFGDYYKREAIHWSWEYITEVLKIDKDRLWVSVYLTDDEAYDIWKNEIGIPEERIVRLGDEENWWAAGPIGSCGPCSEIHYDTRNMGPNNEEINAKLGDEGNRYLEIWNLVFTEFTRLEDGTLQPLPEKNIDTGAGLERIAAVLQQKENNFETDIFSAIMDKIEEVLKIKREEDIVAVKIIADHIRAATFLIGDGVLPSNEGRGYILKKLIRRAFGAGSMANKEIFENNIIFLYKIVPTIIESMKEGYPELVEKEDYIINIIKGEEEKFSKTINTGTELLLSSIEDLKKNNNKEFSADISFKLYDTYGFPFEFTELIVTKEGLKISEKEFNEKLQEQIQRSKNSRDVASDMVKDSFIDEFKKEHGATEFTGYSTTKDTGKVLSIRENNENNQYELILDKTPFYSAQGGQVSDKGFILSDNGMKAEVVGMIKKNEVFIHIIRILEGNKPKIGDILQTEVDKKYRQSVMKNHSGTHLLHKALKEILGDSVEQSGSLVEADYLRFDFSYHEALTKEQIKAVENRVNEMVLSNLDVEVKYMDVDSALDMGAIALFGDKYMDIVRVVDMEGYSIELCGGTHVKTTGEVGLFKILSEQGKASGIRRIEAITGIKSVEYVNDMQDTIHNISDKFKIDSKELELGLDKYREERKKIENDFELLQTKLIKYELDDLFNDIQEINGVKVLAKSFKDKDINTLKEMVDRAKEKMQSGIVVFGSDNGKAIFVAGVTKDNISKYKAGDIVKIAAQYTDGNGGGRPDFAQAGGKNGSLVNEAISEVLKYLGE